VPPSSAVASLPDGPRRPVRQDPLGLEADPSVNPVTRGLAPDVVGHIVGLDDLAVPFETTMCSPRSPSATASDVHGCALTLRARTDPATQGSQKTSSRRTYDVIVACGRPSGRAVLTTASTLRSRYEESASAVSLVSGPNDAAVGLLERLD
jgi:hypothetical protein